MIDSALLRTSDPRSSDDGTLSVVVSESVPNCVVISVSVPNGVVVPSSVVDVVSAGDNSKMADESIETGHAQFKSDQLNSKS